MEALSAILVQSECIQGYHSSGRLVSAEYWATRSRERTQPSFTETAWQAYGMTEEGQQQPLSAHLGICSNFSPSESTPDLPLHFADEHHIWGRQILGEDDQGGRANFWWQSSHLSFYSYDALSPAPDLGLTN